MTLTVVAWLAMAAYSIHIMEEYIFNWRDWARNILKLPVDWGDFFVTNSIVVAVGIAQAMLAPALPLIPLAYIGLMLVNALVFHVAPMVRTKGHYSPGVFTAIVLFLPVTWLGWSTALSTGVADVWTIIGGLAIGAVLMAYPIVMLKLRGLPFFQQTGLAGNAATTAAAAR